MVEVAIVEASPTAVEDGMPAVNDRTTMEGVNGPSVEGEASAVEPAASMRSASVESASAVESPAAPVEAAATAVAAVLSSCNSARQGNAQGC